MATGAGFLGGRVDLIVVGGSGMKAEDCCRLVSGQLTDGAVRSHQDQDGLVGCTD